MYLDQKKLYILSNSQAINYLMQIKHIKKTPVYAFQLTTDNYTINTLKLLSLDTSKLVNQLQHMLQHAPNFFLGTPVILDFSHLHKPLQETEIYAIRSLFIEYGMLPVGIQSGNYLTKKLISVNNNCLLPEIPSYSKKKSANTASETFSCPSKTKYVDNPVRSGQQIYSEGDLVVSAAVSAGAELFAAGSIHVYGTLRGKAFAGVYGNTNSRIFTSGFSSELVSINGNYLLPSIANYKKIWGKTVCIEYKAQRITIKDLQ